MEQASDFNDRPLSPEKQAAWDRYKADVAKAQNPDDIVAAQRRYADSGHGTEDMRLADCERCGQPTPMSELQLPANVDIDDEWICPKCHVRSVGAQKAQTSRQRRRARMQESV